MSLRKLKWITIVLPPLVIGGFELIRHEFLLRYLTMGAGNFLIIVLTFLLSFWFGDWMFDRIESTNADLSQEQAKRAVYVERERLAQELHDNIAQNLFFLNVQLKKGKTEEAHSALAEIDHHLRQAIFNLRSTPEESGTFQERVQTWVEQWETITGVDVTERMEWEHVTLSHAEQVLLFSIVQEAFTNIRKHSGASGAELLLIEDSNSWTLLIRDDGQGFHAADLTGPNQYGISMMRKRASELRAEFEIRPVADVDSGTEVIVRGRKTP